MNYVTHEHLTKVISNFASYVHTGDMTAPEIAMLAAHRALNAWSKFPEGAVAKISAPEQVSIALDIGATVGLIVRAYVARSQSDFSGSTESDTAEAVDAIMRGRHATGVAGGEWGTSSCLPCERARVRSRAAAVAHPLIPAVGFYLKGESVTNALWNALQMCGALPLGINGVSAVCRYANLRRMRGIFEGEDRITGGITEFIRYARSSLGAEGFAEWCTSFDLDMNAVPDVPVIKQF